MKLLIFLLIVCLLINGLAAIDFITIGQKEIVDYIKNRADLLYGTKLSERNLQDLLSNAVFTGLEEEALVFARGSSVNPDLDPDQLPGGLSVLIASVDRSGSVPLEIVLTSDTSGTTNIALDRSTTKSSSSKSSVGNFVVNCLKQDSFDSTSLDGSITISLGGATDSHNLALNKTIYLAAEVNVTSLGSNWESSSLLTDEGKLLSLLSSRKGSMYVITYESLIRETIQAHEGDLLGGLKSGGKVLVVVNSDGLVSLSGRTISGKVEATWENEAEELVDNFLTLNGSKSRKSIISDMTKAKSSKSLVNSPLVSNEIESIKNWVNAKIGKKPTTTIHFGNYGHGSSRDTNRWGSGHGHRHGGFRGGNHGGHSRRDNYENHRGDWKPSCNDGSTWPSWRSFWDFGYGYRYGWEAWDELKRVVEDFESALDFDLDNDWQQNRSGQKSPSTTPEPTTTSKKPEVKPTTASKPTSPFLPVTTVKVEPEIEVTTMKSSTQSEYQESTQSTIEPEEKPDLSEPNFDNLPKGTTISLWSTRIV